jgi:hypothetical protein
MPSVLPDINLLCDFLCYGELHIHKQILPSNYLQFLLRSDKRYLIFFYTFCLSPCKKGITLKLWFYTVTIALINFTSTTEIYNNNIIYNNFYSAL